VLFGRIDGMVQLIHASEIEGEAPAQNRRGPALVDQRAVGERCPACGVKLKAEDIVAVLPLGPGSDRVARAAARTGGPYEAVAVELHWACHTGDETHGKAEA
jgi:hypothetical protein